MKFAHIVFKDSCASQKPRLAVLHEGKALPLCEVSHAQEEGETRSNFGPLSQSLTLREFIESGRELEEVRSRIESAKEDEWVELEECVFAPAVINPPNIIGIGLNYSEHAQELSLEEENSLVMFGLFTNSLGGHNARVTIPAEHKESIDYEGELGVVIGRTARNVSEEEALEYVFGYTVVNDITARDVQFSERQWGHCKSFDGFTPVGPWVVTADEIPQPQSLRITTEVNGQIVQDSRTDHMIRSVARLIAELSRDMTLLPGTLISTGSPGGAGYSRKPQIFLHEGSEATVTIEKIGSLTSRFVQERGTEDAGELRVSACALSPTPSAQNAQSETCVSSGRN